MQYIHKKLVLIKYNIIHVTKYISWFVFYFILLSVIVGQYLVYIKKMHGMSNIKNILVH